MPSFDFRKIKYDLLIVFCFAVISLLFCYPQLQGKKLQQSDSIHWQAMAREAMAYHDSTGKDVMWSNSMFGGMPTFTTYVGASNTDYPAYIQQLFQDIGKPAYFFFIAMVCFYLLMRVLGINKWAGMAGAVAYAFSSYNPIIIGAGHETQSLTLGYMPAALAGMWLIYREKWIWGAAVLGLALALMFTNNHFQVIYYTLIIFICFGVGQFVIALKSGRLKQFFISTAIALAAGALGVGPTVTSLIPTNEYTKATMRGGTSELTGHDKKTNGGLDKEYAFRWSQGIPETFTLMIPYLYGGGTQEPADMAPKTAEAVGAQADMLPTYWGDQPYQSGPVYFGAVICFLFILGLMIVRSPNKWWMLAACIIGIVLAWGKNLEGVNYFLFDHVPLLNKFRTVEMALVIPMLLFPVLGTWAIQEVINQKDSPAKIWKDVKIAAGITAGICLLLGVGGSMFFNFTGIGDAKLPPAILQLLKDDRASLAMTSGLKSAIYILLAAAMIWAYTKDKLKNIYLIGGLGLLIAIDLMMVAHNYLGDRNYVEASDFENEFKPRPVDLQIMQDKDPYYRVLDFSTGDPYDDAMPAYFHKSIGGYHPAKMEIYQDLIERQMGKGFNAQVLNMLNTKYIIVGGQKAPAQVMPNPKAAGNAWFVDEVKWANTADEEMNGLNAHNLGDTVIRPDEFDPKKTAVIRAGFKDVFGSYSFGKDSSAYVKLDRYGLDDISFKSNNSKDGLAVFSDIYYANGWKAYVDDKETSIMKADYVLRAIKVPRGAHNIRFEFRPASFYNSRKVAVASSILLMLLCLGAVYTTVRNKDHKAADKA